MPVANAVPLKAICALEEVADSWVTDLCAKRLSGVWQLHTVVYLCQRCGWSCGMLRRECCLHTRTRHSDQRASCQDVRGVPIAFACKREETPIKRNLSVPIAAGMVTA